MWKHYRIWKHLLSFPLVILALFLMTLAPELSPQWFTGLVIALLLAVAYGADEIAWIAKRNGRPCAHCGQNIQMRSFSVLATCPHCGQSFE